MKRTTYRVEKMDCPADESLVRMGLQDVAGVARIEIDLPARQVTVTHDSAPALLEKALDGLNMGTRLLDDEETVEPVSAGGAAREHMALIIALLINAAFFVFEFAAGVLAGSMGLVADSLDMLADASVYALSLAAVGEHARRKKGLAATSGYLQLGLAAIGLVEVVRRFVTDEALPDAGTMIAVSVLALVANVVVLALLARARSGEVHIEASWIFTANDIKVNALVIFAAVGVWATDSAVPDLVAGAIIFLVVANGARRILSLARSAPTS